MLLVAASGREGAGAPELTDPLTHQALGIEERGDEVVVATVVVRVREHGHPLFDLLEARRERRQFRGRSRVDRHGRSVPDR